MVFNGPSGFKRSLTQTALVLAIGVLPAAARAPRVVSHFYYVNDPSSRQSLEANAQSIGLVSPQWLAVGPSGDLVSSVDGQVVDWARQHRLPVMPVLINEGFDAKAGHAALANEQAQSALLEQVLEAFSANRFYGIEIDFENIPAADRDAYSDFAARLVKALHRRHGKLFVALPAPLKHAPSSGPGGSASNAWVTNQESLAFDYHRLGTVADFVTLMTYDEHTSPDDSGPIAGLPWVEACVEKVLDLIPRRKTLLGLPLYYRHWNGKSVLEGAHEEALGIVTKQGARVEMDPEQREKVVRFADAQGPHVIWLEDAESLKERLELIRRYGLTGFSAWRLGQEDPAVWKGIFSRAAAKGR